MIIENWNQVAEDPSSYGTSLFPDQTKNKNIKVKVDGTNLVIAVQVSHDHKICGVEDGVACAHTLTDSHEAIVEYVELNVTGKTEDEIVAMLAAGGNYYLKENLVFSSTKTITNTATLNLCLSGYRIENVIFKNDFYTNATITNCVNTTSTIINNSTQYLAEGSVSLYGINKNILVKSNTIGRDKFVSYEVNFTEYNTDSKGQTFMLGKVTNSNERVLLIENSKFDTFNDSTMFLMNENDTKTTFKNVTMQNFTNVNRCFIEDTARGFVKFQGENVMQNITYGYKPMSQQPGFIHVWGASLIIESGSLTIDSVENLSTDGKLLYFQNRYDDSFTNDIS